MAQLHERVVLITGAAKGQGAAEARACAAAGARVVVADIDEAVGRSVAAEIDGTFVHLDVSSTDDWRSAVDAAVAEHGRLDGLVNNAGVFAAETLLGGDIETTRRLIEINQFGTYLGMKLSAPAMIESGGGSIVNIASIGGMRGYPAFAYGSTKWAVRGMTRTAARELAPYGIRVNAVCPGLVDTEMIGGTTPERLDEIVSVTPLGRIAAPDDIVGPVLFLLGDASSYMTGTDLVVDGGAIS